jgi:hypothetical protein
MLIVETIARIRREPHLRIGRLLLAHTLSEKRRDHFRHRNPVNRNTALIISQRRTRQIGTAQFDYRKTRQTCLLIGAALISPAVARCWWRIAGRDKIRTSHPLRPVCQRLCPQ